MNWSSAYTQVAAVTVLVAILCLIRWRIGDRVRNRRRCPRCWYDMAGVTTRRCPECGKAARSERGLFRPKPRRRWLLPVIPLFVAAYWLWITPGVQLRGWAHYTPTTALIVLYPSANRMQSSGTGSKTPVWQTLYERNLRGSTWGWQRRWIAELAGPLIEQGNRIDVRFNAHSLLMSCGEEGLSQLNRIFALTADPDPRFRFYADWHLAGLSPYSAESWLHTREISLHPDTKFEIMGAALAGLRVNEMPRDELLPILLRLLESDDPVKSMNAAQCIAEFKPPAAELLPVLEAARDRWRENDRWMSFDAVIARVRGDAESDFDYRLQMLEGRVCDDRMTFAELPGSLLFFDPALDLNPYLQRLFVLIRDRPALMTRLGVFELLKQARNPPSWAVRELRRLLTEFESNRWNTEPIDQLLDEWTLP